MKNNQTTAAVSMELAAQIDKLYNTLKAEYGCDFAYTIMVNGQKIAAFNMTATLVVPTIRG